MRRLTLVFSLVSLLGCAGETGDSGNADDSASAPDSADTADTADSSDTATDTATDSDAAPDSLPAFDPTTPIAQWRIGDPEQFAEPTAPYNAEVHAKMCPVCGFTEDLFDLAVFDGRMHIAFGDATVNIGSLVPLPFVSLSSPESPTADYEGLTGEEQLDRFRVYADAIFAAGVDAADDAWIGNAYRRGIDEPWAFRRNVPGGVHVHDIARFGDGVLAVGSGGEPEQWAKGEVRAQLWSADEHLTTFQVEYQSLNTAGGDARFTRLLPLPSGVYAFGYKSNSKNNIGELPHALWDGAAASELDQSDPLDSIFVSETDWDSHGRAFVRGADASVQPLVHGIWRVTDIGAASPVAGLAGVTVVDMSYHAPSDEWLLLVRDGITWNSPWDGAGARLWVTSEFDAFHEILAFDFEVRIASIAAWDGYVFFGAADGRLYRSSGQLANP